MSDISIPSGRVIQAARQMLGAKWRHEGRTRFGVDCIGLVLLSLVLAGWRPRDARSAYRMVYPRVADDDTLQSILATEGEAVDLVAALPGDVIVFHYPSDRFAQHCGMLTKAGAGKRGSDPLFAGAGGPAAGAKAKTGSDPLFPDARAYVVHASVDMRRVVEAPMGANALSAFRIAGVVQQDAGCAGPNERQAGTPTPLWGPFTPEEFAAAEALILEGSKLWANR